MSQDIHFLLLCCFCGEKGVRWIQPCVSSVELSARGCTVGVCGVCLGPDVLVT